MAGTGSPPPYSFHGTATNVYSEDCDWLQRMMGYIHYRTVQCELYVPLNTSRDSKHLAQIIHDVIIGALFFCPPASPPIESPSALKDLNEVGILHRDISEGNIMISADGGGRLIDLDLARDRRDTSRRQRLQGDVAVSVQESLRLALSGSIDVLSNFVNYDGFIRNIQDLPAPPPYDPAPHGPPSLQRVTGRIMECPVSLDYRCEHLGWSTYTVVLLVFASPSSSPVPTRPPNHATGSCTLQPAPSSL